MCQVTGRSLSASRLSRAGVTGVGKHALLLAVQQVLGLVDVGDVGRGAGETVHQPRVGIGADVGLHTEVPLVALLGLVHLGIARLVPVLGRGGRGDDGGIHHRALRQHQPLRAQPRVDGLEDRLGQPLLPPADGETPAAWWHPAPPRAPDRCRGSHAGPASRRWHPPAPRRRARTTAAESTCAASAPGRSVGARAVPPPRESSAVPAPPATLPTEPPAPSRPKSAPGASPASWRQTRHRQRRSASSGDSLWLADDALSYHSRPFGGVEELISVSVGRVLAGSLGRSVRRRANLAPGAGCAMLKLLVPQILGSTHPCALHPSHANAWPHPAILGSQPRVRRPRQTEHEPTACARRGLAAKKASRHPCLHESLHRVQRAVVLLLVSGWIATSARAKDRRRSSDWRRLPDRTVGRVEPRSRAPWP